MANQLNYSERIDLIRGIDKRNLDILNEYRSFKGSDKEFAYQNKENALYIISLLEKLKGIKSNFKYLTGWNQHFLARIMVFNGYYRKEIDLDTFNAYIKKGFGNLV